MKNLFKISILIAILSLVLFSNDSFAQKGKGSCPNKQNCCTFVDANNDGICDNFVDANGDGKCDNCSCKGACDGTGKGMGQGKHNCGKFVDANGDGKCDNFVDANGDGKCDNSKNNGSCNKSMGQNKSKGNCGNVCKMTSNKNSSAFTLNQNVPNPVAGTTKISFNLKEANVVKVVLSDNLGNKVKDIFEGKLAAGDHGVDLNVTGLNPGNYFYSVYVGGKVQTKQLILIK